MLNLDNLGKPIILPSQNLLFRSILWFFLELDYLIDKFSSDKYSDTVTVYRCITQNMLAK